MMPTAEQHQKDLQRLAQLRPIDDDLMRCLLKDNIPLAEFVLRIITGKKDLMITDCETQRDMKRLAGARSILLPHLLWRRLRLTSLRMLSLLEPHS